MKRSSTSDPDGDLLPEYDLRQCRVVGHGPGRKSPETTVQLAPLRARVYQVTITDDTLAVDLDDGRTIAVPIAWYPRLAHGTPVERANFEISGAGYGLHWPELDEDIGVEGLLLGRKFSESPESFERWLQRRRASAQ
jgi:Protein of unknown function (DUF2442)